MGSPPCALVMRRGGAFDLRLRRDGLGEFRPHGVALAARQCSARLSLQLLDFLNVF